MESTSTGPGQVVADPIRLRAVAVLCAHRSRPVPSDGDWGGHQMHDASCRRLRRPPSSDACCEDVHPSRLQPYDAALPALSRGYVRVAFASYV